MLGFEPDLEKTFNRGYTRYFIRGRNEKIGAIDSPKSLEKNIGTVTAVERGFFLMKAIFQSLFHWYCYRPRRGQSCQLIRLLLKGLSD